VGERVGQQDDPAPWTIRAKTAVPRAAAHCGMVAGALVASAFAGETDAEAAARAGCSTRRS
jgi:hypothetical protein